MASRFGFLLAQLLVLEACVLGPTVRTQSNQVRQEIESARRQGALLCAPVELATAEAHVEFAANELTQGNSTRAKQHLETADSAVKKATSLSVGCAPKEAGQKDPKAPWVVQVDEGDSDGDGVVDKNDLCPGPREDLDGFEDLDGCPEPDNDNDGVPDVADRCPMAHGPAQRKGCPVEPPKDIDGDGLSDKVDKCPEFPEDLDGFEDLDGCPDVDNDQDGLSDFADQCPNDAGSVEKLGCPVWDKDGDGLRDVKDVCPDEPEDLDGHLDEDGCPDLDNDMDGISDAQDLCPNEKGNTSDKGCPKRSQSPGSPLGQGKNLSQNDRGVTSGR